MSFQFYYIADSLATCIAGNDLAPGQVTVLLSDQDALYYLANGTVALSYPGQLYPAPPLPPPPLSPAAILRETAENRAAVAADAAATKAAQAAAAAAAQAAADHEAEAEAAAAAAEAALAQAPSAGYQFPVPSYEWAINHNLNRFPTVTVLDTAGDLCVADVKYLDAKTIKVGFNSLTAGSAYLN